MAEFRVEEKQQLVIAVVRGDMEVNQTALQNLAKADKLRPAHPEELAAAGLAPGFASPMGIDRSKSMVIVDDLVTNTPNLVCGANETDYHFQNSNYGREYEADAVGPIACVFEGAPCVKCGNPLTLKRGIEVGNIFQLGTRYTEALGANYVTEDGQSQTHRDGIVWDWRWPPAGMCRGRAP